MKKKLILLLFTLITVAFCFAGCNNQEEIKYTITFEVNGGTTVESVTTSFLSKKPITSKKDYYFENWYYNEDFSGNPVVFPVKPTKNLTLYAKFREGIFDYTINDDDTLTITNLLNCPQNHNVVIPNTLSVNGKTYNVKNVNINSISYSWLNSLSFMDNVIVDNLYITCDNIKSIDLSKLLSIEKVKITACSNLTSVILPNTNVIPARFLTLCGSIESITIPHSVTKINKQAFAYNGKLKVVTFENNFSLKEIGEGAFAASSIESINIPSSVTNLYRNAFIDCTKLKSVTLNSTTVLKLDNVFKNCSKELKISVPSDLLDAYKQNNKDLVFIEIKA